MAQCELASSSRLGAGLRVHGAWPFLQGQVRRLGQGQELPLQEEEEGSERQNPSSPDSWSGLPLYRGTGTLLQESSLLG